MKGIAEIEFQRQQLQRELDLLKTQEQRNILGQFSTPPSLALEMLRHAAKLIPPGEHIRFIDPAIGTGVFFCALNRTFAPAWIEAATGYEIDTLYGKPSQDLWRSSILDYQLNDFTKIEPPSDDRDKFNLIICNPPYVRHHHLNGQKERLQATAFAAAKIELSGLAGLYCYFLALSHRWMRSNGIAGWLIPSEFMDVNYGAAVKEYLLDRVSLLHIHRFDPHDTQFDDALVSSAIVWFQNKPPSSSNGVKFTYGGTLECPIQEKIVSVSTLAQEKKWSRFPVSDAREVSIAPRLGEFFSVKRGIATGDNKYFILTKPEIEDWGLPISQFKPILPSPRYLKATEVMADNLGDPAIECQLFVLDCKLPLNEIELLYPKLYEYLKFGIKSGVAERYLCRSRKLWYAQEHRDRSYFYCTYMGRSDKRGKKSFRFILNHSQAIVANSYLILYPQPAVAAAISNSPETISILFEALNGITQEVMVDEGRVYGGGMHKLEPKELENVPLPSSVLHKL